MWLVFDGAAMEWAFDNWNGWLALRTGKVLQPINEEVMTKSKWMNELIDYESTSSW